MIFSHRHKLACVSRCCCCCLLRCVLFSVRKWSSRTFCLLQFCFSRHGPLTKSVWPADILMITHCFSSSSSSSKNTRNQNTKSIGTHKNQICEMSLSIGTKLYTFAWIEKKLLFKVTSEKRNAHAFVMHLMFYLFFNVILTLIFETVVHITNVRIIVESLRSPMIAITLHSANYL